MMKLILIISTFATTLSASAEWSTPQVRYWAHLQGITNDTSGVVVNADDGIEGGWLAEWGPQPTREQIEAVDYKASIAWIPTELDAAEIERKSTPEVHDHPLEMPSIILPSVSDGVGHEYFADNDGTLLSIVAHASPMKSKAERDALKEQAKAKRAAAKTDWRNNSGKGQLQARIEALEAAMNELLGSQ